ncbi:selenocysteine-specific translation elongation factor [Caldisalinibacter kiritimatiensis]|uniref:Selenocysteine-specific elongation factor n=1 Tax=Caldisalinibacter kiritimatiensis TaxID=1304284 RepID=R1CSW8_9FIRM|nr:selenocysteine-specific translation elongation factor [Caldisalinibacter kiritimatiensis]EOC99798.1 Selenocysteine-specific translation elongation factor [Caldisalinibacter kiritimatiensis]
MNNIIIGTAGHIDHGKTTLIKALTGRDTDRLEEEKKRGISIELGFTYFDLPRGRRAGIIDVPGHEKFIKNMLAGVVGMDIVALVVAADEGVMPQTKEHLAILNLLGIENGIVVLTKIDLVDDEWMELVKEDIKDNLRGTFLENSPILPVSSTEKTGIKEVIKVIDRLTEEVQERDITQTPRLPVDRSFTITGFGTVVTGTLLSGEFKVGDEVQVFPGNKVSRIRSIQVHGENTGVAYAGQRVAINLANLKKYEVSRGNVIAPVDSMKSTMMLDVKLKLLKDSKRIIENRPRLRLHIGTTEVLCRVVLLDREQLTPGESCYAQLRLEDEVVANRGDKFIIRFYSPVMTIGGGIVLEGNPPKRKRFDQKVLEELKVKEKGDSKEIVEKIIKKNSEEFPNLKDLNVLTTMSEEKIRKILDKLVNEKRIITFKLSDNIYAIHKEYYSHLMQQISEGLKEFHENNPLKIGMLKEELKSKYLNHIKPKLADTFINRLTEENVIKQDNEYVSLKDFEVKFNETQEKIKREIEKEYLNIKFQPLKFEELPNRLKYDSIDIKEVFEALIQFGVLIRLKDNIILHKKNYLESIDITKAHIKEYGCITVGELRDILNTNRKYAIAILEDFDSKKITKRIDNKRVLY